MIKPLIVFVFLGLAHWSYSQVVLSADGPGDTYALISSVLAPGNNPIEVPDCNHENFGEHIDELFDSELGINVFRFHIHVSPDDDRCINFDRQRNEIKSYSPSPDNLLGVEQETVVYKWKFKLPVGFQSSSSFTHLHQLKSVGGSFASIPLYTLTARKGTPDKLELRYAIVDNQVTLIKEDLAPFLGNWVEVTETITYGAEGSYEIDILRLSDSEVLLSYSRDDIVNWREGAEFVRPKWGIYRSLNNEQDLRDEEVLFADFSIEEIATVSSEAILTKPKEFIVSNLIANNLHLINLPSENTTLTLFGINGKMVLQQNLHSVNEAKLDVSALAEGVYIAKLESKGVNHTKLIVIH